MVKGYDLAVYIVDDTILYNNTFFNRNNIWPACLPKEDGEYVLEDGEKINGYISGWDIGNPLTAPSILEIQQEENQEQALMEEVECADIFYNSYQTNTAYPPRSKCFITPNYFNCPNFGNSGSGIVRRFQSSGFLRYSFLGPMSFHRGCVEFNITKVFGFSDSPDKCFVWIKSFSWEYS